MNTLKSMLFSVFVFAILFFCGFGNANLVQAQGGTGKTITSKTKAKTTKTTTKTTSKTTKTTNTQTRRNTVTKVSEWEVENLVGTWQGIFSEQPTTLEIESVAGSTFYGTLTQGEYQIAFTGFIDKNTRRITITETQVLQEGQNGVWALGINNGTLAVGGNKMSGNGKDGNRSYSWWYTKIN